MKKVFLMIFAMLLTGTIVSGQTFKYIGADKCKACHNKPATGDQYAKWLKDPHSQAMKSLSSQASLDYAKKNGIADPTKEASCLACHSTFDQVDPKLRATILQSEGVSCESCHGPGSSYKSPAVMKNVAQAKTMGLVIPDRKLCLKCHNDKNPFHKEFVYETYFAKVNHPDPSKTK